MRYFLFWFAVASLLTLAGCAAGRSDSALRQTGGNAALFAQFQAFEGQSGRKLTFDQIIGQARSADVVLFGEEHSDVVCNAIEAQLLVEMNRQPRPVTLAMEFFESDAQPALNDYLNGRMNEAEFRKQTRQKRAYATAHRPLIEFCRTADIPVIAANAPWRLMRSFRKSGLAYDEFLATLDPSERALLPRTSDSSPGPYYDRFVEAMAGHVTDAPSSTSQPATQPASTSSSHSTSSDPLLVAYRAQSLWDDAMAEAVADYRGEHTDRRVMLIVGAFHVQHEGGTSAKLRRRRPHDTLFTIVYRGTSDIPLAFDKSDRGAGDVVIYGIKPPEEEKKSQEGVPTSAPAIAPATMTPVSATSIAVPAPSTQGGAAKPASHTIDLIEDHP